MCFDSLPEVLSAKDIASYLDIGYAKALRLLKYDGIPNIRVGNTFRVSKQVFGKWLNKDEKQLYLQ